MAAMNRAFMTTKRLSDHVVEDVPGRRPPILRERDAAKGDRGQTHDHGFDLHAGPPSVAQREPKARACDSQCAGEDRTMKYLHTMIRVTDPDSTVRFFSLLGLEETRRMESEKGRFTLIYLAAPDDEAEVELTYNWDPEEYSGGRNFGHIAFQVDDIYATCQRLKDAGVTINRPPRDGHMAFVRTPDGISIELLQDGYLEPAEPWASMPNTGTW